MKHGKSKRKLSLKTGPRRALLRGLAGNLILRGKITTTEAKAKELRPFVERLVTSARAGTLASRRLVTSRLGNGVYTVRLCDTIAPRYLSRQGGYTRVIKLGRREGDASPMAVIEFV